MEKPVSPMAALSRLLLSARNCFRVSDRGVVHPNPLQPVQLADHRGFPFRLRSKSISTGPRVAGLDHRAEVRDGLCGDGLAGHITPASIDQYLYTVGLPDPDLIIRTSGEVRLSGFLL